MLRDFQLPAGVPQPATSLVPLAATSYCAARWTPASLVAVVEALVRGGRALRELPEEALIDAWSATVEAFLDPRSPERRLLEERRSAGSRRRASPPGSKQCSAGSVASRPPPCCGAPRRCWRPEKKP
jgi:hypothetical protein